ncbi:MAG TPA: S41 family peptidase [Gemmatimonadaceae bacterium]
MRRAARRLFRAALLAAVLPVLPASLRAQNDSLRIARLTALGRLFGVVKYFHPAFLERDVPWDSAVIVAIDSVNAAKTSADYRAAVAGLLKSLSDPASQVATARKPGVALASAMRPSKHWEASEEGADSTLVIAIPDFENFMDASRLLTGATAEIRRAARLVFDLRGAEPDETGTASFVFANSIQGLLPTSSISAPAQRMRMHSGFVPQLGGTSGGYWSGTYEKAGALIQVATLNRARRIVFLANPGSDIPDVAFALRSTGQGAIVVEGTSADLAAGGNTYPVEMGEGFVAVVRIGSVMGLSGADTVVSRAEANARGDAGMRVALDFAKRPQTALVSPQPTSSRSAATENSYPSMRYPRAAYRILAGYRYWNAIHYFYPYKHLIGEDWGNVLPRSIRMLDAARDSLELGMALATMVTYTHDSHSGVTRNVALTQYLGRLPVAVQLQFVEGLPVVVRIGDDSATKASGIAVGDVIVKVDGEDAAARRAKIAKFVAHSTPQALDDAIHWRLLLGNDTVAKLVVRGRDNRDRDVTVPRRQAFTQLMQYPRAGPVMKMLPGNIGYADLSLLTTAMVDSMFEMFKNTKGIILDDRGYPQGTAWAIAPRLSARPMPAAAFQRPLVMSPDSTQWTSFHFIQLTPPGYKWVYPGKTVLLVDERTISQAEHTGLFFEAANKTTIVGSPTMGANGDVTTVALVGGMYATFTGHDVRHADGRQLQRVGLQPDVVVRPTLAGIRAGRDEVLERAIELLARNK